MRPRQRCKHSSHIKTNVIQIQNAHEGGPSCTDRKWLSWGCHESSKPRFLFISAKNHINAFPGQAADFRLRETKVLRNETELVGQSASKNTHVVGLLASLSVGTSSKDSGTRLTHSTTVHSSTFPVSMPSASSTCT